MMPPLRLLKPDMLLALASDVLDTHVGGVLQQQQKVLQFFSRRLLATEVNYTTFDRELLAAHS
jgi:RNase H-like domain found in reverse transcriptase